MEVAVSVTMTGDGLATASPVTGEESSGGNVQLERRDPQGRSPQQQSCPLQPGVLPPELSQMVLKLPLTPLGPNLMAQGAQTGAGGR